MLKVFSYLNNIHKGVLSVFYIIILQQIFLPFKKNLKTLPSDLPIVLVLKVAFLYTK